MNAHLLFSASPGSTSLSFLKVDVGARPSALSGAYTSYGDDAFSFYYNPALAVNVPGHRIDLMHYEYFEDINYENISGVFRVKEPYSVGIGINYLYVTGIARTIRADNMEGYSTAGTFGSSDLMLVLCNSFRIKESMSVGLNMKYITETIDATDASTFCVDLGFSSVLSLITDPRIGISLLNMGFPIKYAEKREALPVLARFGISTGFNPFKLNKLGKKDMSISLDLETPFDNDPNIRMGCEFWFIDMIALRLGYKLNMNTNDLGDLSVGGGLQVDRFDVSYAFVPFQYLNNTHRFSAGVRF